MVHVGIGYDVHALVAGRELIPGEPMRMDLDAYEYPA